MASTRVVFLDKNEEDLIHDQSIRSLGEIGVKIPSKSVLDMLEQRGARVDRESLVARFPESMVAEALDSAPEEITLCARDPKHDLKLPAKHQPYAGSTGLGVFVSDYETGEYKPSDRKDLASFTRLADALDGVDFVWPALAANDVDPCVQTFHELWTTLQNTTKHVMGDAVHGAEHARLQIELVAMIAGGRDELKRRPIFSALSCPLAPLSFDKGAVEAQVEMARFGIPLVSLSMSLGGLSAPVTVAGMITNANTENLASLVISQSASSGAPHIFGSDSTPMDLQTGAINYAAAEYSLVCTALAQMANRYRLPSLVGAWGFETFSRGRNSLRPLCVSAASLLSSLSHTDLTVGLGGIDSQKGICYKQLVYDAYNWELCRELGKKVEISERTAALDVVREVGHGHDFLTHRHTADNFRNELTLWEKEKLELVSRDFHSLSDELGRIVAETLRTHEVPGLDEHVVNKGYEMISAYEKARLPD